MIIAVSARAVLLQALFTGEPMTRLQKVIFLLMVLVALILGVLVFKAVSSSSHASQAALNDAGIILLSQGRAVPAVTMTNQDGQPVALDKLKGKWSLLFFGYTFCPDICPTTLAQLREIKGQLPKASLDRLQIILVSVDPNRDTPQQLKQYLGYFKSDFQGLTGTVENLTTLSSGLSIPFIPADTTQPNYSVRHSGNLAVIGPDGRLRGFIRAPLDNQKLIAQLPELLRAE